MSIVSLFRGKTFTNLELFLLNALRKALPPECGEILRRQLEEIHHTRRSAESREVLYYVKKGKPSSSPRFAADRAELKFATMHFSVDGYPGQWTADFHLVSGYFFSIHFTPTPRQIQNVDNVQIERIEILHDPCEAIAPPPDVKPIPRSTVRLPAWLEALEPRFEIRDLFEPLPGHLKAELRKEISAVLPDDYLELIDATDGLAVGPVGILGLSQVYESVMPDWNYYFIAEVNSIGMLGVKAHGTDGEMYFLEYEANPPWPKLGNSLARAVADSLTTNRMSGLH